MTRLFSRWGLSALAVSAAVLAITGCGGTAGAPSAHIRVFNAATTVDATKSLNPARIVVNTSAAYNDLKVTDPPSPYLFVETKSPSTFSYMDIVPATNLALLPVTTPTTTIPLVTTYQPATDQFYTGILAGRPDQVLPSNQTSPATALRTYAFPDAHPAVPSGSIALRVLNAAPDAGTVDILLNGAVATGTGAVPYITQPASDAASPSFQILAAGTYSISVQVTGVGTVRVPATSITFAAGNAYTLLVTEPTNIAGAQDYQVAVYQD